MIHPDLLPPSAKPGDPCYLLQVPPEIRLEIFRYLLFPDQRILLYKDIGHAEETKNEADGDWSDMGSDNDLDWDEEDYEIYNELGEAYINGTLSPEDRQEYEERRRELSRWSVSQDRAREAGEAEAGVDIDDDKLPPRPLQFLRANRQINLEASALFYAEGILVFEPEDIFCLKDKPTDEEPSIWRHHPLKDPGQKLPDGSYKYERRMLTGMLEPHVFAKFRTVEFDLFFEEHFVPCEIWINEETLALNTRDAARYKKSLGQCNLIKAFVKLISLMPQITRLSIKLGVTIKARSISLDKELDIDIEEESDEDANELTPEVIKILEEADHRATDLFLESKIMRPLAKLTNVKTFELLFESPYRDTGKNGNGAVEEYAPSPKHVKQIQAVKAHIESHFIQPEDV